MGRREKPLEPSAGPVQRLAYELRELRAEAGGPTYRTLAHRVPYSAPTLSAAAAGERLPSLPVLLAYVEACGGGVEEAEEWERRWYETLAAAEPAPDGGESPYPGLARFGPADRSRYHGRDDLVAELLALTARRRVTAIVGASGSGKSSLLRAGLVPVLRESGAGEADAPADAARPRAETSEGAAAEGVLPRGARAGRTADASGAVRLAAIRILTPGERPAHTHRALFEPDGGAGDTLLVVDQFEEVFSLCRDRAERDRFLQRLLAARDPGSRLRVVLAVRADFYGRCAEHGPLADVLRDAALLVGPMPPHRLREAIVRPAAAERLVVERALTARMVADVGDEPGGLPLMAHALREVWRRRSGKTLTLAAYEAIGGVRGAIAHTAEDVFGSFGAAEAATVRALLLRMVAPGDGTQDTRRTVDRAELPADCGAVLERLVAARLLTVDGSRVDLAHEALISAWPRLRGWIETDRERLRLHRSLTEAALIWRDLDRDPGALYRGTRLAAAREAFTDASGAEELTALEREFLDAAVAAHDHGARVRARSVRRTRTLLSALAVLLCLAAVAGTVAWQQNRASDRRAAEAEARRIAGIAQTLRASDPRTAMRLGVAAWRIADLPETREAVRTAGAQREKGSFLGSAALNTLDARGGMSADGREAIVTDRGRVTRWDLRDGRRVATYDMPGGSQEFYLVSGDGRLIAKPGKRGYTMWDVRKGRVLGKPLGPGYAADTEADFGADNRSFVIQTRRRDGTAVEVWDVRRQRRVARFTGDITSNSPFPLLSPDGRLLATCSNDGRRLTVRQFGGARPLRMTWPSKVQRQACGAEEWTFTPDSRAVAFTAEGGFRTWEVRSARERPRIDLPYAEERSVDFSADGTWAATVSGRQVALWRTATPGTPLMRHTLESRGVGGVRLDESDGAVRLQDGARMIAIDVRDVLKNRWLEQPLESAEFSPDGRTLAAAQARGKGTAIQLRDARRGGVTTSLLSRTCQSCDRPLLAFSPSGGRLAYASDEKGQGATTVRRWNVATGRQEPRTTVPSTVESLAVPDQGRPLTTSGTPAEMNDDENRQVDVWRVDGGTETRLLRRRTTAFGSVLSSDGRTILTLSGNLIDLRTGRSTSVLRGASQVETAVFSPDGRFLAVSEGGGKVTLWNAHGTRLLGLLTPGSYDIAAGDPLLLAFSPDSHHLALGREDGTVRLWETGTPRLAGAEYPGTDGPVLALGFTRDELRVTTPRTPVRTLPLSPERVADRACARAGGGLTRNEWRTYLPTLEYRRTC